MVGLPIALLVIAFAIANRQWTRLSLDPFSSDSPTFSINMPLWALFVLGVFIGILLGWASCWIGQGKYRRLSRERGREVTILQSELDNSKAQRSSERAASTNIGLMP